MKVLIVLTICVASTFAACPTEPETCEHGKDLRLGTTMVSCNGTKLMCDGLGKNWEPLTIDSEIDNILVSQRLAQLLFNEDGWTSARQCGGKKMSSRGCMKWESNNHAVEVFDENYVIEDDHFTIYLSPEPFTGMVWQGATEKECEFKKWAICQQCKSAP